MSPLVPALQPSGRANLWTSGEDDLIALGIRKHKTDWQEIQAEFFPTKTPAQVGFGMGSTLVTLLYHVPLTPFARSRKARH